MFKKLTLILAVFYCTQSFAGELTHNFVNPDFGGNPLNGAPLLNNANAQNSFTASSGSSGYVPPTPLTAAQTFKNNLNSQILNKLSQVILNTAFPGTGANQSIPAGTTIMGDYTVTNDVANNSITVSNTLTGEVLVNLDLNSLSAP